MHGQAAAFWPADSAGGRPGTRERNASAFFLLVPFPGTEARFLRFRQQKRPVQRLLGQRHRVSPDVNEKGSIKGEQRGGRHGTGADKKEGLDGIE